VQTCQKEVIGLQFELTNAKPKISQSHPPTFKRKKLDRTMERFPQLEILEYTTDELANIKSNLIFTLSKEKIKKNTPKL